MCLSNPLLDKQFLTIYSSVLLLCHFLLYVICPICKSHPSSLSPILSPSILQLPPALVLFWFLCRVQRDPLCLVFCNCLKLIWLLFLRLPVCNYSSWGSSKHGHGGSEDLVSLTTVQVCLILPVRH